MRFDRDEVRKIAVLSRLEFDDAQAGVFAEQLSEILGYIDKLNEVDTEGVEPSAHSLKLVNILREDAARSSLSPDEALANAPESSQQCFQVPQIIQESSS